jgi:hypothetical protein
MGRTRWQFKITTQTNLIMFNDPFGALHLKSGSPDSNQQQEVVAQWCLRIRRKMMKQAEVERRRTQMGQRHGDYGSMGFVYILCMYLSLSVSVCLCLSLYFSVCLCQSLSVNVSK